ncbi:MAG TPA: PilX N-terminal domain-containing pilus assembly protein [Burkholderiales bacterium]|nr:PilX N-terminal domain-containing pilus assembly protein [Burkholderiales bacterium]
MMQRKSQRGATLVIALIMLVLLTLFALSAMNTGTGNLKIVGNMQSRTEAISAAQEAIETVISSPLFIANPANAVLNACGAANTICTDINGDGTTDYTTRLNPQPACVTKRVKPIAELDLSKSDDIGCTAGQQQTFGVTGTTTGNSLCADTVWEITAETTSALNGAQSTVTQGIGVRISADNMATSCL